MSIIEAKAPAVRIERDAAGALLHYQWPGNVDELHQALGAALQSCDSDVVTSSDLPDDLLRALSGSALANSSGKPPARALREFLRSKNVDPDAQNVTATG